MEARPSAHSQPESLELVKDAEVHDGTSAPGSPRESASVPSPSPASAPAPPSLLRVLQRREYWGKLLGTAGSWFLFDVTFYGNQVA